MAFGRRLYTGGLAPGGPPPAEDGRLPGGPPGGGALPADVGRLLGRLYAGGGAAGAGGGVVLGEPVLEAVLEPGPEPGGGGGLARSVPALTCSLKDCFCLSSEPVLVLLNGGPPSGGPGMPGGPGGKPVGVLAPGIVGGVIPSGPVPEN